MYSDTVLKEGGLVYSKDCSRTSLPSSKLTFGLWPERIVGCYLFVLVLRF